MNNKSDNNGPLNEKCMTRAGHILESISDFYNEKIYVNLYLLKVSIKTVGLYRVILNVEHCLV